MDHILDAPLHDTGPEYFFCIVCITLKVNRYTLNEYPCSFLDDFSQHIHYMFQREVRVAQVAQVAQAAQVAREVWVVRVVWVVWVVRDLEGRERV
jgi:hypothetical protein